MTRARPAASVGAGLDQLGLASVSEASTVGAVLQPVDDGLMGPGEVELDLGQGAALDGARAIRVR